MLTLALAVVSSLLGADPAPAPLGPAPAGLVFEARLVGPERVAVGAAITLEMALVNRGATPLRVVKPGDGSESGWREPWVHFSATRADGAVVATLPIGRCGLFDPDWEKDVVVLAPGARLVVHDWIPEPQRVLALDAPGRYTIVVHYVVGALPGKGRNGGPPPKDPANAIGPYEVTSTPVAIELVRAK